MKKNLSVEEISAILKKPRPKEDNSNSPLAAYQDAMLFGIGKVPQIIKDGDKVDIEISRLVDFELTVNGETKKQPFRMYDSEKLRELADNIRQNGVLSPITVRPLEGTDKYQILAGHNRRAAAELAGLDTVPCIVRYVDDERAQLILVDTNLNQREKILPSEKAFAYKMRMDAMKRQGQRTDLTSDPMGRKLDGKETAYIIGEHSGDSQTQVRRYIRLTFLVPKLLEYVDEGRIAVRAGVELSFLDGVAQKTVGAVLADRGDLSPSIEQAKQLRKLFAELAVLHYDVILSVLNGTYTPPAPPQKEIKEPEITTSTIPSPEYLRPQELITSAQPESGMAPALAASDEQSDNNESPPAKPADKVVQLAQLLKSAMSNCLAALASPYLTESDSDTVKMVRDLLQAVLNRYEENTKDKE